MSEMKKALCIGGVAHGMLVTKAPMPWGYRHPKRLHSAPRNFVFDGEPNNMGEIVGFDEYDLRLRTGVRLQTQPVYVLRGMSLDEAADYFDALTGWVTETKPDGASWCEPEPTEADAAHVAETKDTAYQLSWLRSRVELDHDKIGGLSARLTELERKYNYDVSSGGFDSILERLNRLEASR